MGSNLGSSTLLTGLSPSQSFSQSLSEPSFSLLAIPTCKRIPCLLPALVVCQPQAAVLLGAVSVTHDPLYSRMLVFILTLQEEEILSA